MAWRFNGSRAVAPKGLVRFTFGRAYGFDEWVCETGEQAAAIAALDRALTGGINRHNALSTGLNAARVFNRVYEERDKGARGGYGSGPRGVLSEADRIRLSGRVPVGEGTSPLTARPRAVMPVPADMAYLPTHDCLTSSPWVWLEGVAARSAASLLDDSLGSPAVSAVIDVGALRQTKARDAERLWRAVRVLGLCTYALEAHAKRQLDPIPADGPLGSLHTRLVALSRVVSGYAHWLSARDALRRYHDRPADGGTLTVDGLTALQDAGLLLRHALDALASVGREDTERVELLVPGVREPVFLRLPVMREHEPVTCAEEQLYKNSERRRLHAEQGVYMQWSSEALNAYMQVCFMIFSRTRDEPRAAATMRAGLRQGGFDGVTAEDVHEWDERSAKCPPVHERLDDAMRRCVAVAAESLAPVHALCTRGVSVLSLPDPVPDAVWPRPARRIPVDAYAPPE